MAPIDIGVYVVPDICSKKGPCPVLLWPEVTDQGEPNSTGEVIPQPKSMHGLSQTVYIVVFR